MLGLSEAPGIFDLPCGTCDLQSWLVRSGFPTTDQTRAPCTENMQSATRLPGKSPKCSVQFSHSVVSDSLQPHELQHTRPPCPSPTLRVYPNPCPSSWWSHPAISFSVAPFSSCPQSLPGSSPKCYLLLILKIAKWIVCFEKLIFKKKYINLQCTCYQSRYYIIL